MTDQRRDRIAAALYERERPPRDPHWPDAYAMDREVFEAMADAVLPAVQSELDALARVRNLQERWLKAGPPPLGTSMARWWDKKLIELHEAISPPEPSDTGTPPV